MGGVVSREEVYEIGGYGLERTLRGFTRPAKRIMQNMQDEGLIASAVVPPLTTVYGGDVVASGFRIPEELIALLAQNAREGHSSSQDHADGGGAP